jgi:hypothetical protein
LCGKSRVRGKISGFVNLEQSLEDKFINFKAIVSPLNDGFDMILGKPWLQRTEAVPDHGSHSLTLKVEKKEIKVELRQLPTKDDDLILLDHKEFKKLVTKNVEDVAQLFMVKFVMDSSTKDDLNPKALGKASKSVIRGRQD